MTTFNLRQTLPAYLSLRGGKQQGKAHPAARASVLFSPAENYQEAAMRWMGG